MALDHGMSDLLTTQKYKDDDTERRADKQEERAVMIADKLRLRRIIYENAKIILRG
jgi:hypothetical protein